MLCKRNAAKRRTTIKRITSFARPQIDFFIIQIGCIIFFFFENALVFLFNLSIINGSILKDFFNNTIGHF